MRLTIDQYATQFKMSKEMVHSKLRSKKLNFIQENGKIYIILPDNEIPKKEEVSTKPKLTVATLIELYKRENKALKKRIAYLEEKIDKLIQDKEDMLKAERERIEKIYLSKDEQLKTVLELINAKLQLEQKQQENNFMYEAIAQKPQLIELKEYLKSLDLDPQERKKIKKRFHQVKGEDIRVQEQNGKIYLNLSKYDYTDLLSL